MSKEEILNSLQQFILSAIPESATGKWLKAELHVWVQPNLLNVYGYWFTATEETPLEMYKGKAERRSILWLLEEFHKLTANRGQTNWNSGLLTLVANEQIKYNLSWDQIRQEEVNLMNRESAKALGMDYVEPVWDWD